MTAIAIGQEVNWALAAGIIGGFTVMAALAAVTAAAVLGTLRLCRRGGQQ